MIDYSINTNFCDKNKAAEIIQFCIQNGEQFFYNPNKLWDCIRIYDTKFKDGIIDILNKKYDSNEFKLWFDYSKFNSKNCNISLTSYYDGRYLSLHKDKNSEFTTIILLSNGFDGGQFVISDDTNPLVNFENLDGVSTFDLKLGDSISFNGSKTYHGVLPVTNGVRYALNIWMTESDYNYPKLKNNKTLL